MGTHGRLRHRSQPDPDSKLPYLLRVPVAGGEIVLKARDRWPHTAAVYCDRAEEWPDSAEVLEEVPVRSCARRGKAVDLVLARPRENRAQFVFTTLRGREAIFWQSPRTTAKARPTVRVPTRRASGWVAELLAAVQIRYPSVPIVFCETRPLAEEWTYRWLGAALTYTQADAEHAT
jgi:hypothetical protein